MEGNNEKKKCCKISAFFKGLFEKMDKKMEEKAKAKSCCCKSSDKGNDSCCS